MSTGGGMMDCARNPFNCPLMPLSLLLLLLVTARFSQMCVSQVRGKLKESGVQESGVCGGPTTDTLH